MCLELNNLITYRCVNYISLKFADSCREKDSLKENICKIQLSETKLQLQTTMQVLYQQMSSSE